VHVPLRSPPNGFWVEKVVLGLSDWATVSTEEKKLGKGDKGISKITTIAVDRS
jgi:hypothetical protein